jgi:hypothetical protein
MRYSCEQPPILLPKDQEPELMIDEVVILEEGDRVCFIDLHGRLHTLNEDGTSVYLTKMKNGPYYVMVESRSDVEFETARAITPMIVENMELPRLMTEEKYVIKDGDTVFITVYNADAMDFSLRVLNTGTVEILKPMTDTLMAEVLFTRET